MRTLVKEGPRARRRIRVLERISPWQLGSPATGAGVWAGLAPAATVHPPHLSQDRFQSDPWARRKLDVWAFNGHGKGTQPWAVNSESLLINEALFRTRTVDPLLTMGSKLQPRATHGNGFPRFLGFSGRATCP